MATSASTTRRHQSATNAKQRQEQQVEETRMGGTTTTTSTTTTSTTGGGGDPATKPTLEEQLDKAEYAVRKSKYAAAQVHYWWRQHLFRLSLLVFLLSFHQARRPSEACIQNIKVRTEKSTVVLTCSMSMFLACLCSPSQLNPCNAVGDISVCDVLPIGLCVESSPQTKGL